MSQIHTFVVRLKVSDKIYDDNEIREMANNILQGLVYTANTSGLTPEDSESFTQEIDVSQNGIIMAQEDLYG